MSVISPEDARKADDRTLSLWADLYPQGTGEHAIVANEISRRNAIKRSWRIVVIGLVIGGIACALNLLWRG